jgi:chemotaxis protein MotB
MGAPNFEQSLLEYEQWKRVRAWPGWLAFALALGAGGAFLWFIYRPAMEREQRLASESMTARESLAALVPKLEETERKVRDLQTERDRLAAEHAPLVAERQAALDALQKLEQEISSKLETEVQSGDIAITRRGNDLVVDVADKILFDLGKSEIKEDGEKVLAQLAGTLVTFKERIIQIGGHTDSARAVPRELAQRYPTNWELSTARATNVVRFLQEKSKIPGDRLLAAGFAQYRPTANRSDKGRQKNRRIEIVLVSRYVDKG